MYPNRPNQLSNISQMIPINNNYAINYIPPLNNPNPVYYQTQVPFYTTQIPMQVSNPQMQTNTIFPNSQDEELFTQKIKTNLETNLLKIPEKFSSAFMNKIKPKFEENNENLNNFKNDLQTTENNFLRMGSDFNRITDHIDKLDEKIHILVNKEEMCETLIEKIKEQKINQKFNEISAQRHNEKILSKFSDEIDMLKFQISEIICLIDDEIFKNLHEEESCLDKLKNKIVERFSEVKDEFVKILNQNKPQDKKQSLKKFNEKVSAVKTLITAEKNNKNIFGIDKKNFTIIPMIKTRKDSINFVTRSETSRPYNTTGTFDVHFKKKSMNFAFFN
jgi:hypothetical protein